MAYYLVSATARADRMDDRMISRRACRRTSSCHCGPLGRHSPARCGTPGVGLTATIWIRSSNRPRLRRSAAQRSVKSLGEYKNDASSCPAAARMV